MAPMRRAFSVCDPPPEMSEDDEDGASGSANGMYDSPTHAEYARRHHPRPALPVSPAAAAKVNRLSPYGPGGLPGFGDNEMDGKILPCHKVKEDGLVRISHETVSLLSC
jgi:M-phase inducer tyrosine phosphatase